MCETCALMFIDLRGEYLNARGTKQREARENYTSRSFIIFTVHQKSLLKSSQGK